MPESKVRKPKTEKKVATKSSAKAGITANVVGRDGKKIGTVALPKEIFQAKVNPTLMAQAVRVYLANQRSGSAHTKTRSEVKGSTRKIYRQKGTGKARHGANKAPIFVGGGIALGPRTRDFSLTMPKQMRRRALFSALSEKLSEGNVVVVDKLQNIEGRTREIALLLKNINKLDSHVLFVLPKEAKMVERAARNIDTVTCLPADSLNTYEVLKNSTVVLLKDAVATMEKTYLQKS